METVTHDISFSFDRPDEVLSRLLAPLQQRLNQPMAKTSKGMLVRDARTVLIIDAQGRRRQYIGNLLVQAGFRCLPVRDALEAFTLFLQGAYVPFAVIMGQEDSSKHFFLLRLLQQMERKYDWETPLLRLHVVPSSMAVELQTPIIPSLQAPASLLPPPTANTLTNTLVPQTPPLKPSSPVPVSPVSPTPLKPLSLVPVSPVSPTPPPISAQQVPGEKILKTKVSLEGQSLGRYRIETRLGESEHSTVYQTYDRLREQDIALKAIQTDAVPYYVMEKSMEDVTIFQQEAELLRNLNHPHILPVSNYGKSYISGSPFIYKTMPYCPEGALDHWIFGHGGAKSFSARDVVHVALQLADALQYAHSQQILYQNFKLSNILVRSPADKMQDLQVAFVDFSIVQDGTFYARSPAVFPYMAPECWNGVALPESDQYGLAVIAYELLTGRQPFQGSSEHVMKLLHSTMQPQAPSTLNPSLPPALNTVLLRALAKKPEERFASLALFAASLQRACG